jgi:[ribosomal protein S5]-alanine N-acetyltransferase
VPRRKRLPQTPVLESARLVLRPIRAEDAPVIQRHFPHWDVVKHLNARVPWPYPADGAAANMIETLGEMQRREKFQWAITLKGGDDALIGRISLWPDDGKSREMRGFWLAREYWGRGIMTEAAERVTEYAFLGLGWPNLWLRSGVDNAASHRIKEKQGARIVDRVPAAFVSGPSETTVWLLTREDWLRHWKEIA